MEKITLVDIPALRMDQIVDFPSQDTGGRKFVDGAQSLGALPVEDIKRICAGDDEVTAVDVNLEDLMRGAA